MDVRKGVDVVVASAPFLKDTGGSESFAESLQGGGKSLPLSLYKLAYTEKFNDVDSAELANLRETLAVSDQDATMIHETVLAPKLDIKLGEALRSDPVDVSGVTDWVAEVGCPESLVKDKFLRASASPRGGRGDMSLTHRGDAAALWDSPAEPRAATRSSRRPQIAGTRTRSALPTRSPRRKERSSSPYYRTRWDWRTRTSTPRGATSPKAASKPHPTS